MIRHEQLREDGVVIFGSWESLYFDAQSGFMSENTESKYEFIRSAEFIKFLAELGVNQYWTHFFKGYGQAFEKEAQKRTIPLARLCHQHGIMVMAYVSLGSLTPGVLLESNPEAEDWIVKTLDGTPARWLQSFRTKPCYTARGYIDHIKKAVDHAFEVGCDGIHFDNMGWSLDSDGCRCERCLGLFREFLASKYGTATPETTRAGQLRFGRNTFSQALPPFRNTNEDLSRISVANEQEWRLFKMKVVSDMVRELSDYIRARGKLVEFNALWCPFMNHTRFGLDLHEILSCSDMVFEEGTPRGPVANKQGSPMTRLRSFKVCAEYGVPMLCVCRDTLALAESFAFNPGSLGMSFSGGFGGGPDGTWRDPRFIDKMRDFYRFYHRYKHYQTKSRSIANVAVLHHGLSMTFGSYLPYHASACMEQLLQEACIPFRILFSDGLENLSGIDLLIIPAMDTMSDRERDLIARAVKQGGMSLQVVKEAGTYDELNRRRSRLKKVQSMRDLGNAFDVEQAFAPLAGEDFSSDFVKQVGKGAVGFVKELELAELPRMTDQTVRPDQVDRPLNSDTLLASVRELLGDKTLVRVDSEADVATDILRRDDTGEGVIHVLNVSFAKEETAGAKVWFRWHEDVQSVTELRYNRDPVSLPFSREQGGYVVELDGVEELSTLVVNRTGVRNEANASVE